MTEQSPEEFARQGFKALQDQDAPAAFARFSEAKNAGIKDRNVYMGLAISARALGKSEAGLDAINHVLSTEPKNCSALIIKADINKQLGNSKQASAFYMAALQAAPTGNDLTPQLRQELLRAQDECASAAQQYEDYLRAHLDKTIGHIEQTDFRRCKQSLEMMFGKIQPYQQQPLKFYFPELPQRQFYEREEFTWSKDMEAATEEILVELENHIVAGASFEPYVKSDDETPHLGYSPLTDNQSWSALHFYKDGQPVDKNLESHRQTANALAKVPQPHVETKSPTALFSRMLSGAHITPHNGLMNTRLICHLPLIVPDNCYLRVGNQTRHWERGKLLIFDDSIEHEARNGSQQSRIILLFDIWRPELSEAEQAFVTSVFTGIEAYN